MENTHVNESILSAEILEDQKKKPHRPYEIPERHGRYRL